MTPDQLRAKLVAAGLERYADALVCLARPSIRFHSSPWIARPSEVGATRLGGDPDLPEAVDWPSSDNGPLSFVAQINLADTAALDLDQNLPKTGLLSFFYDAEQRTWGFDPADSGAWAVLFTPPGAPLVPRPTPESLSDQVRYKPCSLRAEVEITYPPWELAEVEALGLPREELFSYAEVVADEAGTIHRLLGHPNRIQRDMQLECQLVTNGLYCGDDTGYEDPRAEILRSGAGSGGGSVGGDMADSAVLLSPTKPAQQLLRPRKDTAIAAGSSASSVVAHLQAADEGGLHGRTDSQERLSSVDVEADWGRSSRCVVCPCPHEPPHSGIRAGVTTVRTGLPTMPIWAILWWQLRMCGDTRRMLLL
ncbi:MAG TPA: YwqG family protein [Actinomycetota bacterium]